MGIEEDFYATIKLNSGEEIFAKVAASEEEDRTLLIVSNPVIVNEIKSRIGVVGYKIEPWLKTTKDDMFILKLDDILTMSESSDIEMILMYQSYVRDEHSDKTGQPKLSKKMGFISTVNDAKEILEKIYKSS
ncbi:methylamine utilization protein [Synechococcus phage SynMITS9220M01]|nr:methylamine utilization protein [Synechococcus phage SynMITS9220M01]